MDTHGLPLEVILSIFEQRGLVPDWLGFIESAKKAGWNPKGTRAKLQTAVLDMYGSEYLQEWQKRLDLHDTLPVQP